MSNKIVLQDGIGYVELLDHMGDDLAVVNAARVSMKKQKQEFDEKDERLVKFLAREGHWTPFGQVVLKFRIKMPIFVARQYFKHQIGITRNEMSRRYVTEPPEFFLPAQLRKGSEDIKQGSIDEPVDRSSDLLREMQEQYYNARRFYERLLRNGVAAEQARIVLPQSTYTEFIETGSLEAYSRVVRLRDEATAQREIQEYAVAIKSLIHNVAPVSWAAKTGGTHEN